MELRHRFVHVLFCGSQLPLTLSSCLRIVNLLFREAPFVRLTYASIRRSVGGVNQRASANCHLPASDRSKAPTDRPI